MGKYENIALQNYIEVHANIDWHYFCLSNIEEKLNEQMPPSELLSLHEATRGHLRRIITKKKKSNFTTDKDEAVLKMVLKLIRELKKKQAITV